VMMPAPYCKKRCNFPVSKAVMVKLMPPSASAEPGLIVAEDRRAKVGMAKRAEEKPKDFSTSLWVCPAARLQYEGVVFAASLRILPRFQPSPVRRGPATGPFVDCRPSVTYPRCAGAAGSLGARCLLKAAFRRGLSFATDRACSPARASFVFSTPIRLITAIWGSALRLRPRPRVARRRHVPQIELSAGPRRDMVPRSNTSSGGFDSSLERDQRWAMAEIPYCTPVLLLLFRICSGSVFWTPRFVFAETIRGTVASRSILGGSGCLCW